MTDQMLIPLANSDRHARIDRIDFKTIKGYSWCLLKVRGGHQYVVSNVWMDGANHLVLMHRLITDAPADKVVHLKNGDGLDCTRDNLAVVSRSQLRFDTPAHKNSKTGVRGVYWQPERRSYRAMFVFNKRKRSRSFKTISEAEVWIVAQRAAVEGAAA